MSLENGRYSELAGLLEALCEQRLSPADSDRLEHLVLADAGARRFYLDYIDLHGALYWDTAIGAESDSSVNAALPASWRTALSAAGSAQSPSGPSTPRPAGRSRVRMTAIAASLLLALLGGGYALLSMNGAGGPDRNIALRPLPVDVVDDHGTANVEPSQPDKTSPDGKTAPSALGPQVSAVSPPADSPIAQLPPADAPLGPQPSAPGAVAGAVVAAAGSSQVLIDYIDSQVQSTWEAAEVLPSERADDAEWVRRVYLDLVGHIPTADEVEEFLHDKAPAKRSLLVDRLLDHPDYVRHWTTVWTNLLIGRSESRGVNRDALKKYLRDNFAQNRPWNEMVYEFVAAEGNFEENPAANFLLAHLNNEAVPATAITAKVFLGTQVQCTQCHDHPFNDWKQNQFWEFNSFFQQTARVEERRFDKTTGQMMFVNAALTTREVGGPIYYETRRGVMRVAYPKFDGVQVDPGEGTNRRAELARLMTTGEKPQMAEAVVNRLWAHFFGYGFTRPVDDMGPHNPPTHPQLLDRLAREFVASGYDLKQLVRWIVNSSAYQLTSRTGEANGSDDPATGSLPLFSRVYVKPMTAEQLYDSLIIATGAHRALGSPAAGSSRAASSPSTFADWTAVEARRQEWLQQFILAYDTEENDEASTFEGTIPQALMMMNGELIERAVSSSRGTYFEEVVRSRDAETEKIKKLCLSALSRYPTSREIAAVRKLLRDHVSRAPKGDAKQLAMVEGLQDVFWAYLNSSEFILVH